MAERQILRDAVSVRRVHKLGAREPAAAPRTFGLEQMPLACVAAQHFAVGRDFEPFGHRLFRFNAFWTSHKCLSF